MPSPVDADRLAYSYINLSTLAISALHSEPSPLRLWRRPAHAPASAVLSLFSPSCFGAWRSRARCPFFFVLWRRRMTGEAGPVLLRHITVD